MIAKAEDVVSHEAIKETEKFISLHLTEEQRHFAINCFRSGKELPLTKGVITKRAFQLYGFQLDSDVERWLEPLQILDILLRVGMASGSFTDEKNYIVDSVRSTFGFPVRHFWSMRSAIAETFNVDKSTFFDFKAEGNTASENQYQQYKKNHTKSNAKSAKVTSRITSKKAALLILKLEESASIQDIKLTYRKLVKMYHPDMLKNNQANEEEIEKAIEAFCSIQEAYEYLIQQKEKQI